MRVALFSTCIGDALFPDAHKASALVLSRLGYDVVFPEGQTCCGQMHVNTGYQEQAVPIIQTYADAFADPSIDYVVAPSGSCAGAVREQHVRLAERYGNKALVDGATQAAKKTYELTEFIVDVAGVTNLGAFFPHRVTYHESCHSRRFLKVGDRPYKLLEAVEGIELVDLPNVEECCGFGGTFSVKLPEVSAAMVSDKVRHIKESKAEFVTAGDSSCLMNIAGAMSRQHNGIRALHIAEILASTKEHPWTPTTAAYSKEKML
ncbi:Fe-S oxidoreductase [Corynebacterium sp. NML98-0116]|uniref:(Fe-S)-binding protein n=1 Tax=Corynebacterium pseudogenitalium TaxID=38303 RepID=A0ABD4TN91_9CORY|nr:MULTISPECIES: (Fe-S)-binding protein [Corynebacterium]AOX05776.1 Fe-S oxidoreductase [Corynebacterium sp. NML98-0116]MCQ4607053.1 (Fe-S)-binding protein [Corynebacterium pseudogenitalium]MCQ4611963.1 (Fe-S)-binding protein [Corynebacterium sp. CCUG 51687]MCQ4613789.1 (Fe-S)-binding protein [Corynebacterium pseudogenitalium]MCQ4616530.1 (Fe-S)-binding protein [Corynebacterium pseudogenitalium]